jgi:O-antigen chain-terminating methyltransferase
MQKPTVETSSSDISVDRLMHDIRVAVARRQRNAGANGSGLLTGVLPAISRPLAHIESSPLSLQPEFQPSHDNQYHVNDLLKYHGADFVRIAYHALLKRKPDEAGFADHLEQLASGRLNKIDILANIRYSAEGERAQVKVKGLAWPATVRRLGRAPVVGYLIQLVIAAARLPRLLAHQRQSEFYLSAQIQQVVDHNNQVQKQLAEAFAQMSAQVADQTAVGAERTTEQQRLLESLLQQQQDLTARQAELKVTVEGHATATRDYVDQFKEALAQVEGRRQELLAQQQEFSRQLQEHSQRQLGQEQALAEQVNGQNQQLLRQREELTQHIAEQAQQFLRRQQQTHTELVMQERRLTILLEAARGVSPEAAGQPLAQLMASEEDHILDALYASFEDQFRGEREDIKSRLKVYLPILKTAGVGEGVLDIGCGRGEWLEKLRTEGVQARGVDHNRVFVEQCRELGLDVVEEDALVYLRSLPDESLNVVTSFHLVEHLPFDVLIKLLDEAVRTLKSGGMLILETPNPENVIVGSYSFYADPTHRNPIPSPTLKFLLESRGLSGIKIMNLRASDVSRIKGDSEIIKRFNQHFYSAPDYGIVGWKA